MTKSKVEFSIDGQDFVLFLDKANHYVLAGATGDKLVTYPYRAKTIDDLILQYPFIKKAAKNFVFDEQMDDIIRENN